MLEHLVTAGFLRRDVASTEMDLRMLTYVRGRERNLEALTSLAADAGLAFGRVTRVQGRAIAEFAPG